MTAKREPAAPRVALYARVSRDDQTTANQLPDLRRLAATRRWKIHETYVDHAFSGGLDKRPQLDRLMEAARAGKFGVVAVWKFDRFGRSTRHLVTALEEFQALGVDFVSVHEGIDTSTPVGKMVYTIMAAIAEFERSLIGVRVKAGLARRKAQGKPIGRARRATDEKKTLIVKLKSEGRSWRKIAMSVGLPRSTVRRAYREAVARSSGDASRRPPAERRRGVRGRRS